MKMKLINWLSVKTLQRQCIITVLPPQYCSQSLQSPVQIKAITDLINSIAKLIFACPQECNTPFLFDFYSLETLLKRGPGVVILTSKISLHSANTMMWTLTSPVIRKKQKAEVQNTKKVFIFMEEGMQKALNNTHKICRNSHFMWGVQIIHF